MPYPKHLVPLLGNGQIEEFEDTDFLGVWVESEQSLKAPDGTLNPAIIEIKRLPGFSMNKLPSSLPEDLLIKVHKDFKDKYLGKWDCSKEGLAPADNEYELNTSRKIYFLRLLNVHLYSESYQAPNPNLSGNYKFELHVKHDPLSCNYWHFELHIYDLNAQKYITDVSKAWKKLVCSAVRDHFSNIARFEMS